MTLNTFKKLHGATNQLHGSFSISNLPIRSRNLTTGRGLPFLSTLKPELDGPDGSISVLIGVRGIVDGKRTRWCMTLK
ncbi:LOW QUALITY PROTEIN: hypothetical protein Smp_198540 [Schistosoma mansoni]|uniref:hypothetical protein n=1 Tax=Schistosoma mansoni TaxID=6183 RepID=UPI00022DC7A6|nr:LOW QUALITY PROTEIN: hypothetical protein Smp_198540 [Schistosoma mansoni]|eukprot:XP_018653917.1 LOW QUALITY PROTEIN: hypothetical protein Smp_198540 [Schistosoma mansoni]